jgi:hypothetical protein
MLSKNRPQAESSQLVAVQHLAGGRGLRVSHVGHVVMTIQSHGANHAGANHVGHVVKSFCDDYMTNNRGVIFWRLKDRGRESCIC